MARTSDLSLRGAKRRGNLAEPGWIAGYSRRKRDRLREIATSAYGLLAMTRQGNTAVHQRPSAVELPRTGRSMSALQAGNIQGMYFMA